MSVLSPRCLVPELKESGALRTVKKRALVSCLTFLQVPAPTSLRRVRYCALRPTAWLVLSRYVLLLPGARAQYASLCDPVA
eukprot:1083682-Rhodomonas_salina.2